MKDARGCVLDISPRETIRPHAGEAISLRFFYRVSAWQMGQKLRFAKSDAFLRGFSRPAPTPPFSLPFSRWWCTSKRFGEMNLLRRFMSDINILCWDTVPVLVRCKDGSISVPGSPTEFRECLYTSMLSLVHGRFLLQPSRRCR